MFQYDDLVEEFNLQLQSHSIKISRIKNVDTLFDRLLTMADDDPNVLDERMPYWADVWPSAIALAHYIDENPEIFRDKKVIEIGCGLGLPGIVAAFNCRSITMSDYLQEALDFAEVNWKINHTTNFNGKISDWRKIEGKEKFDVILASDVAYESRSFKPLIKTFKSLLHTDGVLLISEPNRKFTSPFIIELQNQFITEIVDKKCSLDGIEYIISIYKCKLKKGV